MLLWHGSLLTQITFFHVHWILEWLLHYFLLPLSSKVFSVLLWNVTELNEGITVKQPDVCQPSAVCSSVIFRIRFEVFYICQSQSKPVWVNLINFLQLYYKIGANSSQIGLKCECNVTSLLTFAALIYQLFFPFSLRQWHLLIAPQLINPFLKILQGDLIYVVYFYSQWILEKAEMLLCMISKEWWIPVIRKP